MESVSQDGFLFERGPNTVLDRNPSLDRLLDLVGLPPESVRRVPLAGQDRYVFSDGRLHAVPSGPLAFLRSELLSGRARLRTLAEPFAGRVVEDEPLAAMVRRRIGAGAYDALFLPMVQGIWAGDPERMSAEHSFPLLKSLEREHGGWLRGMIARGREARRERRRTGEPRRGASMIAFDGGMRSLAEAIARRLGDGFRPGFRVASVAPRAGGGWLARGEEGGRPAEFNGDHLVLATSLAELSELARPLEPELAGRLRAIRTAPMVVVGLGVERDSARIPPGFGFLARRGHGLRVLGAIFNSNFMPGRAPEGCFAMTVMLGGELDPDAFSLDDEAILATLRADLGRAIAWDGRVRVARIERWPAAIPQYGLDHGEVLAATAAVENRRQGLHFLGNWRGGTSIPDRIERSRELAERIPGGGAESAGGSASGP